jgi:phosphoglucosamine mutase
MGRYFGTDGIRGVVNETLTADLAYRAGAAAATVLAETRHKRPLIVIGRDTRISGDMLQAALTAGICSAGGDVIPLGVLPTPAIAYLTVQKKADLGIVISASHNPYEHNGIKMFNDSGYKVPDEIEARIEDLIDGIYPTAIKTHGEMGRVIDDEGRGADAYVEYLAGKAEGPISGLRVAVDCSNGAASATAAKLFSHFAIDFELLSDHPNGVNINDKCGSTHMQRLCDFVVSGGFDLGIAFDGDADRCLIVDETGREIDGDRIMAMCGSYLQARGRLRQNAIVATVMSNMGLHEFGRNSGIDILCANVGDRNVLAMMQEKGCSLGGEQSGHIIFLDDATTGDGQLAAVKILSIVAASGKTVSELVDGVPQSPQVLLHCPIAGGNEAKARIMADPALQKAIADEQETLGDSGRILVRPSGTEALIRVMVEAKSQQTAQTCAERLFNLIKLH